MLFDLLHVVRCLLWVLSICCVLCVGRYLLFVVCCVNIVVCCFLFAVRGLLFVVKC